MSLFICTKCNTVDNHSCVSPNHVKRALEKQGKTFTLNKEYPNLHLMQMHGYDIEENSTVECLSQMLCSECNTGTWHGEWEKSKATEEELAYASLSKYNYCTYYDQPVRPEIFNILWNSNRRDYFMEKLSEAAKNKEYLIYVADKDELYERETYQKMQVQDKVRKVSPMMAGLMSMAYQSGWQGFKQSKPHWKETQDQSDKEIMLELAELKREIKKNKKLKNQNKAHLDIDDLVSKYNELKNKSQGI